MKPPELHVMCGLPASGKSTLAAALGRRLDALVMSADAVRTESADAAAVFVKLWRHAEAALVAGRSIVVDACSLRGFERARWLAMGRRNGARCELWIVDTPWRVCHERDRQRDKPSSIQWVECAALVSAAKRDAYKDGWDAGHLIEREAQIALDNE